MTDLELRCGLEPYSAEALRECAEDMDIWGAFDCEVLSGFVTINWTRKYCGGSLYVVNLNVAPEYRGRRIAKGLLYAACRELTRWFPGKMVSLDVTRTNRAMELYKRIGFAVIETPGRNGPEDVVMAVRLERLLADLKGFVEK